MLNNLFKISLIAPSSAIWNMNDHLYITNWTNGLGAPPFHRISERSSGQHGVTNLDFRLDPRLIDFHMTLSAESPELYWYRRWTMTEFIKPSNLPFILFFSLPNGVNPDLERSLKCYLYKGMTFDTSKRKGLTQEVDFTLIAPDPIFYDPNKLTEECQLDFGDAIRTISLGIDGSWSTYPQIVIVGPLLNPSITNTGTGEKIALAYQIAAGETVTIECEYGKKTIKNQAGTNLISKLTTDSDFASFHVDPDLVLPATNDITVTGTLLAGEHAHVTINYYLRYISI